MSYLFHFDERGRLFLRPECIKLCPELSALDENELMFVVKAYDHFSPLRRFPEEDRIRRSILDVYRDNNPKILKAIESKDPFHYLNRAIDAYKSLQYDEKIELINTYRETIEETKSTINAGLTDKEMKEKLANIAGLRKEIKSLENEVTEQIIEQGQLKGDMDLSLLEELQRNKDRYNYITKGGYKPKK